MIEIVPLTIAHLADMGEADDANNRLLVTGIAPSECFALLEDGRPIAAAGCTVTRPGVGLVWTLQPEAILASPRLFRRFFAQVKKIWPVVRDNMAVERFEALCLADKPEHCRWLEHFGFTLEAARMRKYQHGQDYAMFSLVRK